MSDRERIIRMLTGEALQRAPDGNYEGSIAAAQALALMEISETLVKLDNPRYIVPSGDFVVPDGTMCSDCGTLAGQKHGPDCRTGYAREVLEIISTASSRAMATDGAVPPDHEALNTDELIRFFQVAYKLAKAVV